MSRARFALWGALLLWGALVAADLAALAVADLSRVPPAVVPCGTDAECCVLNPALCREGDPALYREIWGKP